MDRKLRIAILGTRGIPAAYGGFETFAEQLSTRLVARGHALTVYGRRILGTSYDGMEEYKGVAIRITPTVRHKYLETPLHALMSFLDLFRRKFDVVLLCNAANSPFAWLVRLRGCPLLINVDGVERKRQKWNILGKIWYRMGEVTSVLFATRIVADAQVIADYYREQYKSSSKVIAYGAEAVRKEPGELLSRFGLRKGEYILYVSRLEPENNALGVIEAYSASKVQMPLVIVGDAPYAREYIAKLKEIAGEKVVFTGYQFGEAYQEFQSNCYLYVQATEVGGTHPALIEAMAYGNCIIANSTPEHHEALGSCGVYYSKNNFEELAVRLKELTQNRSLVLEYGEKAKSRASELYDWERITDQYERLFCEVTGR